MSFPYTFYSSLLTILFPFLLSSLCALAISKLGRRISLVDAPNSRSSHSTPTPRGGGIGIWLSFILVPFFFISPFFTPPSSLLSPHFFPLTSFIAVAGLAGLLGLVEDRFNLPAKVRLTIQLSLSAVAVYLFSSILTPHSLLLTPFPHLLTFLFWITFITGTANFYNFMDGINGIAGLTGIVGFGLMAFFSYFVVKDIDILMSSIVISSACLGFLPFNFPKAKVFMGDVGSVSLGFIFASFVVKLSTTINIFLCIIMFLYTFYADALVTIYYRWRRGENLMKAHRSHLYQYMANELKLSHWKVTTIYAVSQLIAGIMSIIAYKNGVIWQLIWFIMFGIVFLTVYNKVKKLKPSLAKLNLQK